MTSVKEFAFAKVNLYLDVLSRREDGFHDVKTVMHTVSLCDELTVTVKPSSKREIKMLLEGNNKLPLDSRNLAYRAAELFLDATLNDAEVVIKLKKRIPVAAGLAGGSTDAAAVLRALNKAYKKPLTEKRLIELAATLGSDVPFCLIGGTALCYGRGEKMERLPDTLKLAVVIAIADEYVSTPTAYAALDKIYANFTVDRKDGRDRLYEALISSLQTGIMHTEPLYNVFENAIFPICSEAEKIKGKMIELGATHALMSGSGPSVFGIFENMADADRARSELLSLGYRAYSAEST